jgi:hypothetical protein
MAVHDRDVRARGPDQVFPRDRLVRTRVGRERSVPNRRHAVLRRGTRGQNIQTRHDRQPFYARRSAISSTPRRLPTSRRDGGSGSSRTSASWPGTGALANRPALLRGAPLTAARASPRDTRAVSPLSIARGSLSRCREIRRSGSRQRSGMSYRAVIPPDTTAVLIVLGAERRPHVRLFPRTIRWWTHATNAPNTRTSGCMVPRTDPKTVTHPLRPHTLGGG